MTRIFYYDNDDGGDDITSLRTGCDPLPCISSAQQSDWHIVRASKSVEENNKL